MSRRATERETRKKYILDAARRLFDKNGIENTGMEDIALAAEYTRRTLYAYFTSRDEISLSIFIEDLNARWAQQKKQLNDAETGLGKMVIWAESFWKFTLDHPHSIRLQVYWDFKGINRKAISDNIFTSFEDINDQLADGLRDIFRLGLKDRTLRPDLDIDITISQFLYSYRSIVNRALSSTYSFAHFDPDQYVHCWLDIFIRGIINEGANINDFR